MPEPIKPNVLLGLKNIFEEKGWSLSSATTGNLTLFDKFCERLKLFDPSQQELIISLTKRFVRIGLQDYLQSLYESFSLIDKAFFRNKSTIYVYPLTDPFIRSKKEIEDIPVNKTKSGAFLHYMLETDDWTKISEKFVFSTSISFLKKNFHSDSDALILVDDFVGTGHTAIGICRIFLKEIYKHGELRPENLQIVSIAAQSEGLKRVKDTLDIDVFSNIIIPKGISDHYESEELETNTQEMNEIEKKLKIDDDMRFGYGKSEALISLLNKTPNNTFPVYWHETKSKVAPFPRYKNFRKNG